MRFQPTLSLLSTLLVITSSQAFAEEQTITTTTSTSPQGTVVEKKVIVTTTPAPKEVVPTPTGYVSCTVVKAGWHDNVWVAEHNVCSYTNSPEGNVWIEGHWVCSKYDLDGQCTNWDWKSGRWEKTMTLY